MYREIFLTLQKHLDDGIAALKLVDWDLQQYNQQQEDAVITTPAAYIAFQNIEFATLNRYIQRGVMEITVSLVTQTAYGDAQDMTDTTYINHLGIETAIYKALQGKRFNISDIPGVTLGPDDDDVVLIETIERTGYEPHATQDNLIVTRQSFRANVFDYTADPAYEEVTAALNLTATVHKTLNDE